MEAATAAIGRPVVATGIAFDFVVLNALAAFVLTGHQSGTMIIAAAADFGAYMALNIGANDVANNTGPAVGAKALTMGGALVSAVIFETVGALIAGGDVVSTISGGIVAPDAFADPTTFIWAMMAALIASSFWLNLATWMGAPVSTTRAIVGGVMGAGIVAAGFGAVDWGKMCQIAASWVISPGLGGVVAALFFAFIKATIDVVLDKITAARRCVPILIGIMAGTFATYLAMKGRKKLFEISLGHALLIDLAVGLVSTVMMRPVIQRQSEGMENRKKSLKRLLGLPLILSAALLSFAHGANDVANAVGPLAAIVHAVQDQGTADKVEIPLWVMLIGPFGISFGLLHFGPKLIKLVGQEITRLIPMRACCVALSAVITVVIASWLGLPVSSTHIAVGGVFGVGFYREWHAERRAQALNLQKGRHCCPRNVAAASLFAGRMSCRLAQPG